MIAYKCLNCHIHFTRILPGDTYKCPSCGSIFLKSVHSEGVHKYSLPVVPFPDGKSQAAGSD